MPHLATWIRECDEANFRRFFRFRPDMVVRNARRQPVDLQEMDGLLISGGPDIDAAFHHVPPADISQIIAPEPERDRWEFDAVLAACERGLPMLCICKGVQVLNVALGGTLHFHIEGHNAPEMKMRNVQPLRYSTTAHHRFPLVNSSHHQALDRLGEGVEVEAWSASDQVIEQVRLRNYPYALGVQYHPERDMQYGSLFADFFAQLKLSHSAKL
jgi:putative glutamine amidotransferase